MSRRGRLFVDHYARLDLAPRSSDAEIRAQFRRIARECHPDKNPGEEAEHRFKEVAASYQVLSSPRQRRAYDSTYRLNAALAGGSAVRRTASADGPARNRPLGRHCYDRSGSAPRPRPGSQSQPESRCGSPAFDRPARTFTTWTPPPQSTPRFGRTPERAAFAPATPAAPPSMPGAADRPPTGRFGRVGRTLSCDSPLRPSAFASASPNPGTPRSAQRRGSAASETMDSPRFDTRQPYAAYRELMAARRARQEQLERRRSMRPAATEGPQTEQQHRREELLQQRLREERQRERQAAVQNVQRRMKTETALKDTAAHRTARRQAAQRVRRAAKKAGNNTSRSFGGRPPESGPPWGCRPKVPLPADCRRSWAQAVSVSWPLRGSGFTSGALRP